MPACCSLLITRGWRPEQYISETRRKYHTFDQSLQVWRAGVQKLPLKSAIHSTDAVATACSKGTGSDWQSGVEVLGLRNPGDHARPEMSRALERKRARTC